MTTKAKMIFLAASFLPALALADGAAEPAPATAAAAQPAGPSQVIQQDKSAIKQLETLNDGLGAQVQQGVVAANDAQRQEMISVLQAMPNANNKQLLKTMKTVNGKYNTIRDGVAEKAEMQGELNDLQIKTDKKDIGVQKQIIRANEGGLLGQLKTAGGELLGKIKAAGSELLGRITAAFKGGASANA